MSDEQLERIMKNLKEAKHDANVIHDALADVNAYLMTLRGQMAEIEQELEPESTSHRLAKRVLSTE